MFFIRRPVFFRLGRLEVFAEGWGHQSGERWIQTENRTTAVAKEFRLWMPGFMSKICSKDSGHRYCALFALRITNSG
jgi:hypothetical protein